MKALSVVLAVLSLFPALCGAQARENNEDGHLIWYLGSSSVALELVLDTIRSDVVLRTRIQEGSIGGRELTLLQAEVMRLAQDSAPALLGSSGYTLRFRGKYPEWEFYHLTINQGPAYVCLLFARRWILDGRTILAWGRETKPKGLAFYEPN